MEFIEQFLTLPAVIPPLADYVSAFTGKELLSIALLSMSPAIIGPLPILIDLLVRGVRGSIVPYFVMGVWTLAAAIPIALSAFGVIHRSKMLYGGYGFGVQVFLMPAFLYPVFFLSTFIFTLLIGVWRPRLFFFVWLGVAAIMAAPWFIFAYYGL